LQDKVQPEAKYQMNRQTHMKAMIDYGKTAAWVGRINGFVVSNIRGESATQRNATQQQQRPESVSAGTTRVPVPYRT